MTLLANTMGAHPGILLAACAAAGAATGWIATFLFAQRSTASGRAGSHAAAPLVIAVVMAVALFGIMAGQLLGAGPLLPFDVAVAHAMSIHLDPGLRQAMQIFTLLGERNALVLAGAGILFWLAWRHEWRLALLWIAATGGAGLLNSALKAGFQRVRPELAHDLVQASGWSFPSGHATGALAFYGTLAYLLLRTRSSAIQRQGAAVTGALIAAIGCSRVILQAHYISDVLAAWAITTAWLLSCAMIIRPSARP